MNYTTNLNLNKPDYNDVPNIQQINDNFNKIDENIHMVKDIRTGKPIKVRTELDTLGLGSMSLKFKGVNSSLTNDTGAGFTVEFASTARLGDYLYIIGNSYRKQNNTSYNQQKMFKAKIENKLEIEPTEVVALGQEQTSAPNSNYIWQFVNRGPAISENNDIVVLAYKNDMSSGKLYDLTNHSFNTNFVNSSFSTFKVGNFWGFLNVASQGSRFIKYTSQTTPDDAYSKQISLGGSSSSSYYGMSIIGVKGNFLYYIDQYSNTQARLCRIDFSTSTPTVQKDLSIFDISAKGWSITATRFQFLGCDNNYGYVMLYSHSNGYRISSKILKISLVDGSNNWDSIEEPTEEVYNILLSPSYQVVGALNGKIYLVYSRDPSPDTNYNMSKIMCIDKDANISVTTVNKPLKYDFSYGNKYMIQTFNFPHLKNYMYFQGNLINPITGDIRPISYGKFIILDNSTNYWMEGQSFYALQNFNNSLKIYGMTVADDSFLGVAYSSEKFSQVDYTVPNASYIHIYPCIDGSKATYNVTYQEGDEFVITYDPDGAIKEILQEAERISAWWGGDGNKTTLKQMLKEKIDDLGFKKDSAGNRAYTTSESDLEEMATKLYDMIDKANSLDEETMKDYLDSDYRSIMTWEQAQYYLIYEELKKNEEIRTFDWKPN